MAWPLHIGLYFLSCLDKKFAWTPPFYQQHLTFLPFAGTWIIRTWRKRFPLFSYLSHNVGLSKSKKSFETKNYMNTSLITIIYQYWNNSSFKFYLKLFLEKDTNKQYILTNLIIFYFYLQMLVLCNKGLKFRFKGGHRSEVERT